MNKTTKILTAALTGAALLVPTSASAAPEEPPVIPGHEFRVASQERTTCEFGQQSRVVVDVYLDLDHDGTWHKVEPPVQTPWLAPQAPPPASMDCTGKNFVGVGTTTDDLYRMWVKAKNESFRKSDRLAKKNATIKRLRARLAAR